jgi:hypothetical protein
MTTLEELMTKIDLIIAIVVSGFFMILFAMFALAYAFAGALGKIENMISDDTAAEEFDQRMKDFLK